MSEPLNGPWVVQPYDLGDGTSQGLYVTDADGKIVCIGGNETIVTLIAAIPEMLAALKFAAGCQSINSCRAVILAAIEKAEKQA